MFAHTSPRLIPIGHGRLLDTPLLFRMLIRWCRRWFRQFSAARNRHPGGVRPGLFEIIRTGLNRLADIARGAGVGSLQMALLDELQLLDQLTFERRLKMEIAQW